MAYVLLRMTFQLLDESAQTVHLAGNVDLLRAVLLVNAAAALDAVVGLALAGHHAVEADEIAPALLAILRNGLCPSWQS